jgi:hypothetical protein
LAYDGNIKVMEGFKSISSSPNKRKLLNGDNTLQINKKDSVRHTT